MIDPTFAVLVSSATERREFPSMAEMVESVGSVAVGPLVHADEGESLGFYDPQRDVLYSTPDSGRLTDHAKDLMLDGLNSLLRRNAEVGNEPS